MQNKRTKKNNLLSLPVIDVPQDFTIRFINKAVNIIFIVSVLIFFLLVTLFLTIDIEAISNSSKATKIVVQFFNKIF